MLTDILDHVHEQFTLPKFAGLVAIFVLYVFILDVSWIVLVMLAGLGVLLFLNGVPAIDGRYVKAGIGSLVLFESIVMGYLVGTTRNGPVGGILLLMALIGGWIVLDARYDFRHDMKPAPQSSPQEDISAAEGMLLMNHAHLITEELKNGPRTVPELADACDMTESRVRNALDMAKQAGTIHQRGERYILDESQQSRIGAIQKIAMDLIRRIARPLRG